MGLRHFIFNCLTCVNRIKFCTKNNINIINGYFVRSSLNISPTSTISSQGDIDGCRITLSGEKSSLIIKASISTSEIRIIGDYCSVTIEEGCQLRKSTIIAQGNNCHITIGRGTTVGSMYMVCMGKENTITIGKECMLADEVEIWASDSHALLDKSGNLLNPSKPISIGNHVWIGKQAAIMKGVTIGDNAVVGMRSIVTKDLNPGSLNAGSPSKTIRDQINWDRNFITKYEK